MCIYIRIMPNAYKITYHVHNNKSHICIFRDESQCILLVNRVDNVCIE